MNEPRQMVKMVPLRAGFQDKTILVDAIVE